MGAIQNSINQVIGLASIYRTINKKASKPNASLQDQIGDAARERTKAQQAQIAKQRAEISKAYKAVRNYPVNGTPIKNIDQDFARTILKQDPKLQELVKKTMKE